MAGKGNDSFNEITGVFQDLNNVKKESLRGGLGSQPRGAQKRRPNKADSAKNKKPTRKTTFRQETKYQMIKLVKSGRTLREANAMVRALAVGLTPEYLDKMNENNLSGIEYTLDRLTRTRAQQKELLKLKFMPRRKFPIAKEEFLARWLMGQNKNQPIDWTRDGNLIAKNPPQPSRPGSSKGKIGKTRVRGAKRVASDFKRLIASLQQLIRSGKAKNSDLKQILKKATIASSVKADG